MAFKDNLWFGTDLWDPSHRFETSWLISPWILAIIRGLISIYAFTTLLFSIAYWCLTPSLGGCTTASSTFAYFTVLTYWGIAFYFLFAAIHTGTYAATGRPLLDRFPRPLQALHSLFYTTIVTYPFIVTIVYWGLLYSGPWFDLKFDAWRNISEHAMNAGFAIFEIVIPRTATPPWVHLIWLIVILLMYLALAFVRYADAGVYVYFILDKDEVGGRAYVAAYIIGIAVGICVVFVAVWALILLRKWVTEKKMGTDGKYARQPKRHDVEMNTIGHR